MKQILANSENTTFGLQLIMKLWNCGFYDYNQPFQLDFYLTTKSFHFLFKAKCSELLKIASELQYQIETTMWL